MQKIRTLRSRKGFSSLMLLVLAIVFFLIAGTIAWQMQSENDQVLKVARSQTGGSRITFIAQTMQADFFNNLLQSEFELDVANFLADGGPHMIDPRRTFKENLGRQLEDYLISTAGSIIGGEASEIYSAAYSRIPSISCVPEEVRGGGISSIYLKETKDVLEVSSLSIGQRISCTDLESEDQNVIDLRARNYQLRTRALQVHQRAVDTINSARESLRKMEGVYNSHKWIFADDRKGEAIGKVLGDWNGKVGNLGASLSVAASDGMRIEGVRITSEHGGPYKQEELKFACYGEAGVAWQQTCRPDELALNIGVDDEECEGKFIKTDSDPQISIEDWLAKGGTNPLVVTLLKQFVGQVTGESTSKMCVTYSGTTHLCKYFKGKTDRAIISGRVIENNPDYLPSSYDSIEFDFVSMAQGIESDIGEQQIDCSDEEENGDVIDDNILAILSNDGKDGFKINIIEDQGEASIDQPSLKELANDISEHKTFSDVGDVVTVSARTASGRATPPQTGDAPAATAGGRSDHEAVRSGDAQGEVLNELRRAAIGGESPAAIYELLDRASSVAASAGRIGDAESLGKSAAAVCKMIGMRHHMDIGEYDIAMLALGGLAGLVDEEGQKVLFSLAGLYQSIESGSADAVIASLTAMLGNAGFDANINVGMIEAALQTGDPRAVIGSVEAALRLAGQGAAAEFMASAEGIMAAIEGQDVSGVLSAASGILGELGFEGADLLLSLEGLDRVLESGDIEGALRAVGDIAGGLGFDAAAQIGGVVSTIGGAVESVMNFDASLETCKNSIPWDAVCLIPKVGGGICEDVVGDCQFSVGLPTLDPNLLCNDLITGMGFQLECTCVYTCPQFPYTLMLPKNIRVDVEQIAMSMDISGLGDLRAALDIGEAAIRGDIMEFCRLDP